MENQGADPISPWTAPRAADDTACADAAPPVPERLTARTALWRGACAGVKYISFLAGPIAALWALFGVAVMGFGLGAGPGLALPRIILRAFGVYFACAATGAFAGAAIGLAVVLLSRALPRRVADRWRAAASRPLRIPGRRARATPAQDPERKATRRALYAGIAGVVVLTVFGVAAGFGAHLRAQIDRRQAAAIAVAEREDPYWRLDDLISAREVVPDEENSALWVADAVAALPEGWPSAAASARGQPPAPPTRAQTLLDQFFGDLPSNVCLDADRADALRAELVDRAEALPIARAVAGYDRGWHELVVGRTVFDTPLPETQASRNVARLLMLDAALRAHDGDQDGALESCRAILAVGRSIGDEPFLISMLVRIAIGSTATRAAERVLGQGQPSDAALEQLQALLLDELWQPRLYRSLKGERANLVEVIDRLADGRMSIADLSGAKTSLVPEGAVAQNAPWFWLWFDSNRTIGLERMNAIIAIARAPAPGWRPQLKSWEDDFQALRRSRFGMLAATLPILIMPAVTASFGAETRYQATLGAMAILVACERHRLKTGDWPDAIGSIDPTVLPTPLADPSSGEPFRYERHDGRLVIYSVGANGVDEHGEYDKKRALNGGPDDISATAWDVSLRRLEAVANDSEAP